MMIWLLAWIFACSDSVPVEQNVARDALNVSPAELADCERIPFPEARIPCRVSAAAHAAAMGDDEGAWSACMSIEEGLWRDECHFRAGEELGGAGRIVLAMKHCVRAGRYARNCLTHASWKMPPVETLDSVSDNVIESMVTLEKKVKAVLAEGRQGLRGEGLDSLLSSAWFNLYYGRGVADPSVAKSAPEQHAAYARTAFALEAVRLLAPWKEPAPSDVVDQVLAVWRGKSARIRGEKIRERRLGRFVTPIVPEDVRDVSHVATFGGGFRLVGASEEEDVVIATLEALFFRETTTVESFLPYVKDKRDRVRWTAGKLVALSAGQENDQVKAILEGTDEVLRTYVWQALSKNRPAMPKVKASP